MVGLVYIELPAIALMASRGINVHGVETVVDTNCGEIHIIERYLDRLVRHVVKVEYLIANTQTPVADVFLILVQTPFKGVQVPEISYLETVIRNFCPFLEECKLLILESTSSVGTTEIDKERPGLNGKVCIAYYPQRVFPVNEIHELERNDRSIGGIDKASTEKAINFYSQFVKEEIVSTNTYTAEMCKLVDHTEFQSIKSAEELYHFFSYLVLNNLYFNLCRL